jgi:hypothetical protein
MALEPTYNPWDAPEPPETCSSDGCNNPVLSDEIDLGLEFTPGSESAGLDVYCPSCVAKHRVASEKLCGGCERWRPLSEFESEERLWCRPCVEETQQEMTAEREYSPTYMQELSADESKSAMSLAADFAYDAAKERGR